MTTSDTMIGRVHSFESFGTVDGPGIRLVVFLQGCPMRCAYCHNPDSWDPNTGEELTPEEVLARYDKNCAFYSKGGITVTGGEPLMQQPFVTRLFTLAKERGIHTCLDTSGITFVDSDTVRQRMDALLEVTDLVLLDIKHMDDIKHRQLTGHSNEAVLRLARYLNEKQIPVWVRYVLVPGHTDDAEGLTALGRFIGTLACVKALDVLPYHTMGVAKYQQLGIDYPLKGVSIPTTDEVQAAKQRILNEVRRVRSQV